jgi:hypothetical protein
MRVLWRADDAVDRGQEYLDLKASRPDEAEAVRDAINAILADPGLAASKYSIRLDPETGYLAMPYLRAVGMLTCLVWRNRPDLEAVEVVDFGQAWGDDLSLPSRWPRD